MGIQGSSTLMELTTNWCNVIGIHLQSTHWLDQSDCAFVFFFPLLLLILLLDTVLGKSEGLIYDSRDVFYFVF